MSRQADPRQVEPRWKQPKVGRESKRTRRRLRAVSEKRAATFDLHDKLRRAVFDRDGGCLLHEEGDAPCRGPLTVHHRRKAGAQGAWSMENLVALCAFHNCDIEDRPTFYRAHWPWLIVREGDRDWEKLGVRR